MGRRTVYIVAQLIKTLLVRPSTRQLPSVRRLAQQAGCSPVTAWKAVRLLAGQGLVTVVPGGGVFTAPGLSAEAAGVQPRRRWQAIREAIGRQIAAGEIGPGAMLPSVKELAARYRCSPATLRPAVADLLAQGLIERERRGHRVPSLPSRQTAPVVAVIGATDHLPTLSLMTPRSAEFWTALRRAFRRSGLRMAVLSHAQCLGRGPLGSAAGSALPDLRERASVIGAIVLTLGLDGSSAAELLGAVEAGGRPVALFQESGEIETFRRLAGGNTVLFPIGVNRLCGMDMGRLLARHRHRRMLCFDYAPQEAWSAARLEGLREGLGPEGDAEIVAVADGGPAQSVAGGVGIGRGLPLLRSFVEQLMPAAVDFALPIASQRFFGAATRALAREERLPGLWKAFDEALRHQTASAWVLMRGEIGVAAMEFLARRGVAVPARLSVVSFDDDIDALAMGLTSYDFNVPQVVQAMMRHILNQRPQRASPPVVEIPGSVALRESLGVAYRPRR